MSKDSRRRCARIVLGAVLAALACGIAMPVAAQHGRFEMAKRGWLGFAYDPAFPFATRGLVIQQVWDDSPAARAGIQPGDTLLEVNGLRATQQLVASLGSSLEPGDTVRLRMRRGGRDRALTLEAAEPAGPFVWSGEAGVVTFSPDTLRRRLHSLTDSLRVYAEKYRMPEVYRQWQGAVESRGAYWPPPESIRFSWDTIFERRNFRVRDFDDHVWPGFATFGLRAVAGAELTNLTPGLARVFNTPNGVLVLRVPDHTPARRAGLAEADVILRANGAGIASVADLRRIVARANIDAEPARLEVLRDGKRVILVLKRR